MDKSLELYLTFEHNGKIYKVEHAKENKSCHGCAFCEIGGSRCTLNRVENNVPECIGLHRHDGMDVIFVEAPEKNQEQTVEEYARSIANKRYNASESVFEQIKRDCFVEGFMWCYGLNYNPR